MERRIVTGLALGLVAAVSFGSSGALAKGLLESGWTPAAAVTWRVGVAALILALPACYQMRGHWSLLRRGWTSVAAFGLMAVAFCQLSYFFAIERVSVGVGMLLEYLGIVLVVGWLWLRHHQRPRPLTLAGVGLAVAGLLLVLDVFGAVQVDPVGVLWGLGAAAGLATFFIVSADESTGLPPLVVASFGLAVGAAALLTAGALGILPMRSPAVTVGLAGVLVPAWVAVAVLGVVTGALAYAAGVAATRRLGSKLASFVGLTEVLAAVLFAWLLLGEVPAPVQLAGGALILAGVVAVKLDERSPVGDSRPAGSPARRRGLRRSRPSAPVVAAQQTSPQ